MTLEAEKNPLAWWRKNLFTKKKNESLRTVIEDFIERSEEETVMTAIAADQSAQEHTLISNVLLMRDLTAFDVMVPRADIVALPVDISRDDLIAFIRKTPRTRLPVYENKLDDVLGIVHVKDIFIAMNTDETFNLRAIVREVPIISPALPVFDLLHMMRTARKSMMMVVDEYGGIDGLVTASDVVEAIIGRLDDEYDVENNLTFITRDDGSAIADARLSIPDFEAHFGDILTEDEEEEIDTLGGLVMALAGRIPVRGEVLQHSSGLEFAILEADPRRVLKILIRKTPSSQEA